RPSTQAPADGSRTVTIAPALPEEASSSHNTPAPGTLKLRGASKKPRVAWTDDTVDNEGAGKKSSKICCIYHKPRRFDESSDEDSDSSDDDDDGRARPLSHSH
ncbi:hypothetical protein CYLTODRAFT_314074, partial [Cylindrobasidium torrendii FP15055 ss-10]